jgi:sulfur relay (sulfurtransferase) DsrC/TusE family protein
LESEISNDGQKINNDVKQYFINEEKYQLLKKTQQEIYEKTEVSPAMRKLVNEVITEENLQRVVSKFLDVLSK